MLRAGDGFDCLVAALGTDNLDAKRAAALCVRNLAFCPDGAHNPPLPAAAVHTARHAGKASLLAKPEALGALLDCACSHELTLVALGSAALWALLSRCEKAKAALRGGTHVHQLLVAERMLVSKAAVLPPTPALLEASRNFTALAQLLGLAAVQLRAGP